MDCRCDLGSRKEGGSRRDTRKGVLHKFDATESIYDGWHKQWGCMYPSTMGRGSGCRALENTEALGLLFFTCTGGCSRSSSVMGAPCSYRST